MPVGSGILIAIIGSALINVGMALQKRGAADLPKIGKDKGAGQALFSSRIWRFGLITMLVGWGMYLWSANIAPISIVQPALGVGLLVLAGFSIFYLKEQIKLIEWLSFFAMIAGIVLLGLSAEKETPREIPQLLHLLIVTAVILAVSGLAYILGKRGSLRGIRTDSLLGIVAGLFIGLAALYIRGMFLYAENEMDLMAFGVCLPALIMTNIVGITVVQSGFQHGKALVVVGLESVLNKVVAISGGMLVLHEHLPEDSELAIMRIAAFALILFGSAFLARFGGEKGSDLEIANKAGR